MRVGLSSWRADVVSADLDCADSSHASRANAERNGNFSQNQDFVLKSSEPKSSTLSR